MTPSELLILVGFMIALVDLVCVVLHFRFFGNRDLNLNIAVLVIGGLGVGTGVIVFIAGLLLAIWNCIQQAF